MGGPVGAAFDDTLHPKEALIHLMIGQLFCSKSMELMISLSGGYERPSRCSV